MYTFLISFLVITCTMLCLYKSFKRRNILIIGITIILAINVVTTAICYKSVPTVIVPAIYPLSIQKSGIVNPDSSNNIKSEYSYIIYSPIIHSLYFKINDKIYELDTNITILRSNVNYYISNREDRIPTNWTTPILPKVCRWNVLCVDSTKFDHLLINYPNISKRWRII